MWVGDVEGKRGERTTAQIITMTIGIETLIPTLVPVLPLFESPVAGAAVPLAEGVVVADVITLSELALVLVEARLVSERVMEVDNVEEVLIDEDDDVLSPSSSSSSPERVRLKYRDVADGLVSPVTKIWKKKTAPFFRSLRVPTFQREEVMFTLFARFQCVSV